MMSMRVVGHGKVAVQALAQIKMAVSDQQSLKDMMAWALRQPLGTFIPQIVAEVIMQDEFTHDVIVPRSDGLVLVYDTTDLAVLRQLPFGIMCRVPRRSLTFDWRQDGFRGLRY